ncbi:MAG: hypothetical protein KDD47_19390, partial [Acidobacteria bacterium]|nr:hypothetical protein [Acidobacteriota bacterium]
MKAETQTRWISEAGWLVVFGLLLAAAGPAFSQPRAVNEGVSIRQDKLLLQTPEAGGYALRKVLESGGQFFTVPYIDGDGYGEGPRGPRAIQRSVFYPWVNRTHPEQKVIENGQENRDKSGAYSLPFLRLNGIDSQSCYECHSSIGVYHEPGTVSSAMTRKPGVIGGGAGRANTLFQNADWPTYLAMFYRNPPHVFGTGYGQRLADEMTLELQLRKSLAQWKARFQPGQKVCDPLQAKTTSFGTFCTTFENGSYVDDLSQVEGVASDLVVRPFQFKGIASTVRHFVSTALDFHFGMQGVEKVGANLDCDRDGKVNEMAVGLGAAQGRHLEEAVETSLGNVAALSSFVAMTRPPQQVIPAAKKDSILRGEKLFRGEGLSLPPAAAGMCTKCHTPSLNVQIPVLSIAKAEPAGDCPPPGAVPTLGSARFGKTEDLPILRAFNTFKPNLRSQLQNLSSGDSEALYQSGQEAITAYQESICDAASVPEGYKIHLTDPGTCTGANPQDLPPFIYPRLKPKADGSVDVPLYSDLKLHDMGEGLAD